MRKKSFQIQHKRRGFVLLTCAMCLVGMIALLGLAYDIGRVYIAKSEAQNFVDAASLAATIELDGTSEGIVRARARVYSDTNRWNFAQSGFSSPIVEFAKDKDGPWYDVPPDPKDITLTRVSASVPVPITFLPVLGINTGDGPGTAPVAFLTAAFSRTMNVSVDSEGRQEPKSSYGEGLFPFSPYAHNLSDPIHYGLTPGVKYTLRWAANFNSNGNNDSRMCPGDRTDAMRELASQGQASDRGYIEVNSSSVIRQTILYDYQSVFRQVGDTLNMTGGAKQTQVTALADRVRQDYDTLSSSYAEYEDRGFGNGRRLVAVPINSGYPNYTFLQVGAFFLSRADEYEAAKGGNDPVCAEYVGAWVKGSSRKGASDSGGYAVKLVR